ncbi:MAG: helix-turn-helix domain-containing protein [Isosphaeraceae bacterium]|jgi:putative transcriptional regulator
MRNEELTRNGAEIVDALTEFYEVLKEGGSEAVGRRFTVRTVELNLEPKAYTGEDVKKVRGILGLSQPLFARFLGVSVNAVRNWENGGQTPSKLACRFLDEISHNPKLFQERIRDAIVSKSKGREPSGSCS